MAPREVAFALGGMIIVALIGWVAAAALHQTRGGGILIGGLIGLALGIGVWRYLSQKSRIDGPVVKNTDTLHR